jgi:stage III sporulation protein AH
MAGPFIMPQGADFFEELKMDRDKTRSREEEVLQRLIDDANTHPDVCRRAQEALLSLAERARREAEAESMIQAQGYERAVVFLSEAGASVVVKSGRLEEAEVWRIGNVVSVATGVELRNISIMESSVKDNSGMR